MLIDALPALKKEYGELMTQIPIKLVKITIPKTRFANNQDGEAYFQFASALMMAVIQHCKVIIAQS